MSPRAAWRLESLGFTKVFDYMAGKADWSASGLPVEGELADYPRAGTVARTDVSTCSLSDRLGDVRDRTLDADQNVCIVVNDPFSSRNPSPNRDPRWVRSPGARLEV